MSRNRYPSRWETSGPLVAGDVVEYRPPERDSPVTVTIVDVVEDGPGTITHFQYDS